MRSSENHPRLSHLRDQCWSKLRWPNRKMETRRTQLPAVRSAVVIRRTSRSHLEPRSCHCERDPTRIRREVRNCEALDWKIEGCQCEYGRPLDCSGWQACHSFPTEPWTFRNAGLN